MFYLLKGVKVYLKYNENIKDLILCPDIVLNNSKIGDGSEIPTTIIPEVENIVNS
jgi:hypothetical protein